MSPPDRRETFGGRFTLRGSACAAVVLGLSALALAKFLDDTALHVAGRSAHSTFVRSRQFVVGFAALELGLALGIALPRFRRLAYPTAAFVLVVLAGWNVLEYFYFRETRCACLGRFGPVGFWPRIGIIGGLMTFLAVSWPNDSEIRRDELPPSADAAA